MLSILIGVLYISDIAFVTWVSYTLLHHICRRDCNGIKHYTYSDSSDE